MLRSDVERKALFGVGETERLPETAYAATSTAKVYATLAEKARRVTAAGHSAIVDAVFAQPSERDGIARAAGGAAFHGLFLTANLETPPHPRRRPRPAMPQTPTQIVARKQEQFDLGHINWAKVDASGTPEETLIRAEGDAWPQMSELCSARPAVPPLTPWHSLQKPCIA